ncbi:replication regulatory protein RepA [Escherichia coli]|uniref:replication regulatory protein RepA n=1 Tax=Escherichia coli TaxID=562 RepID=UPI0022650055|nr:replication regulatory protein RepA [Escherichia coli]EKL8877249.1 replication regulatory protein RepA [Escherichia coli]MCX8431712.1 replication regulatory protein RepA [Escherichia coli]
MSDAVRSATSSEARPKRAYRKGAPLSVNERKRLSLNRKRDTHKALNVFIRNELKDILERFCQDKHLTLGEGIELLIQQEKEREKNGE